MTHLTSLPISRLACFYTCFWQYSLLSMTRISHVPTLTFTTCHALRPQRDHPLYPIERMILPSKLLNLSALPFREIYEAQSLQLSFTACRFSVLRLIHVITSMYPRTRYGMSGIPFPAELSSAS